MDDRTPINHPDPAWEVVKVSGRSAKDYAMALWPARANAKRFADAGLVLRTCGVALFRTGRYRAAIEMLERAHRINGETVARYGTIDLVFQSMAHGKLGERSEARRILEFVRTKLANPQNPEEVALLKEAADLIAALDGAVDKD